MELVPLGVGDAFSSRSYSSCLAVGHEDSWLLVDCPHPIRKILREASATSGRPLDVGSFSALVLTHLHADHASGVEGFLYYSQISLGRRPTLLAHPEVSHGLWNHQLAATLTRPRTQPDGSLQTPDPSEFATEIPLVETEPLSFPPFRIHCRRTLHPIPTFALRIEAAGKTLGLSADTSFDPSLIAWLDAADLIVHETNHGIHTPYQSLAALDVPLRRKMRLIHYPDDFDTQSSTIEPLLQGRLYTI